MIKWLLLLVIAIAYCNDGLVVIPFMLSYDFTFEMMKVKVTTPTGRGIYPALSFQQQFSFLKTYDDNYKCIDQEVFNLPVQYWYNVYNELIHFDTFSMNFSFYGEYSNEFVVNRSDYKNSISLSYNPQYNTTVLPYQLLREKKINKNRYAVDFIEKKIYFGNIPKKIFNEYDRQGECDLLSDRLGCEISEISFSGKNDSKYNEFTQKMKISFDPTIMYIRVPKYLLREIIYPVIFADFTSICLIKENSVKCTFTSNESRQKFYANLPIKINFEFNSFTVSFPVRELFNEADTFQIREESENYNEITLSLSFLRHFLLSFDYVSQKASLYLHKEKTSITFTNKDIYIPIKKKILLLISFLMFFCLICLYINIDISVKN